MAKKIILAPHIDDEVIGCWSILPEITDVYFFYETSKERRKEAEKVQKMFNYKIHYVGFSAINFTKDDIVYAPSSFDLHEDHREINRRAKQAKTFVGFDLNFYSTNMNYQPKFLGKKASKEKKKVLENYKSQATLFNDEKYHLFEDIHKKDYLEYFLYELNGFKISITTEIRSDIIEMLDVSIPLHIKGNRDVFQYIQDFLQSFYPGAEVEITSGNRKVIAKL